MSNNWTTKPATADIIFSVESSECDRVIGLVRASCEGGEEAGIQMITVESTAPPVLPAAEEEDEEAEDDAGGGRRGASGGGQRRRPGSR